MTTPLPRKKDRVWLIQPREPNYSLVTELEELEARVRGALPPTHVDHRKRLVLVVEESFVDLEPELAKLDLVAGARREEWDDTYPYDDPEFSIIPLELGQPAWYRPAAALPPWPPPGVERVVVRRIEPPPPPRLELTLPATKRVEATELGPKILIVADVGLPFGGIPIQDRYAYRLNGDLGTHPSRKGVPRNERVDAIWASLQRTVDAVGDRGELYLLHALEWEVFQELKEDSVERSGLYWHLATAYNWGDKPYTAVLVDGWDGSTGRTSLEAIRAASSSALAACEDLHAIPIRCSTGHFLFSAMEIVDGLERHGLTVDPHGPARARAERALAARLLSHLNLLSERQPSEVPAEVERTYREWLSQHTGPRPDQLAAAEVTVDAQWNIELTARLHAPAGEEPLAIRSRTKVLRRTWGPSSPPGMLAAPEEAVADAHVEIRESRQVDLDQLERLIAAAGWKSRDRLVLRQQVDGARFVVSAWAGQRMIGFARAISDGVTNGYISTVVVDEAFRGRGIGRAMVEKIVTGRRRIRWVLHARPEVGPFYEKMGFVEAPDMYWLDRL